MGACGDKATMYGWKHRFTSDRGVIELGDIVRNLVRRNSPSPDLSPRLHRAAIGYRALFLIVICFFGFVYHVKWGESEKAPQNARNVAE